MDFFCQYKEAVKDDTKLDNLISAMLSNLVQNRNNFRTQNFTQQVDPSQTIPQLYSTESMTITPMKNENKENISQQFARIPDLAVTRKPTDKERERFTEGKDVTISKQQNPLKTSLGRSQIMVHVESEELQRLKNSKEDFFAPVYIALNEEDSKYLFDITVQLKYGDPRTIYKLVSENLAGIIDDYPLESFLFQTELFHELFALMKKSTDDIQYSLLGIYVQILSKMTRTFDLYANPHHKNKSQSKECEEFILADDKPYIKNSYPTLNPPTKESLADANFKKNVKETFPLNYFLTLDAIVGVTCDYF